jgi:hypothetical protein
MSKIKKKKKRERSRIASDSSCLLLHESTQSGSEEGSLKRVLGAFSGTPEMIRCTESLSKHVWSHDPYSCAQGRFI